MDKGQYQLFLGLLVITVIGVSIGIASYYTILKPTVKTNQTTTREAVEEPSCCCELPCDSLESSEIMNCKLLAIDTCPAERPFTCTIVMCTAEKTIQPTTTTTPSGGTAGTTVTTGDEGDGGSGGGTNGATTTITFSTTTTTTTIPPEIRRGLVGEWNLDEGSGTVATDTSGNDNTGTVYGATWIDGRLGKALSFDGTDDYVDVGNSSILNTLGSSSFSVEAWFYENSGANYIMSKGSPASSASSNIGFSFSRAKFYVGTTNSSNYALLITPGTSTNTWHHMVVVRDAINNKLLTYVNGKLKNQTDYSGSYDLSNSNAKLNIGVSSKPFFSPTFSSFFNGTIDKVRIWNRSLSASEIHQLYTETSTTTTTTYTSTTTTPAPSWVTTKSLVDTVETDNGWAIDYPKHRKVFYMSGLFWIFYASKNTVLNSRNLVYKTSSDLSTWSNEHVVKGDTHSGNRFGLWFDGTYIHLAHSNARNGDPIIYRRGIPNANGTITWGTEYVAYSTPLTKNVKYTAVIVDGDGYPWVYTMQFENGSQQPPNSALVIRNNKRDGSGTWTVNTLTTGVTTVIPMPVGCSLTGNKTYWIFVNDTAPAIYYGKLWDGTSWKEEQAAISAKLDPLYNVVCDGDDVHLTFANIKYRKRTWGLGWGSEFTVTSNSGDSGHQVITRTGSNSVVVIWENKVNDHLYYREMIDGIWQPKIDWIDESAEHFAAWLGTETGNRTRGVNINGLVNSAGFAKIVNVYTTGSPPEYKLKVAALTQ